MGFRSDSNDSRSLRPAAPRWVPAGLLCLSAAAPGLASDKSWDAGNGNWGIAGNWTPIGVPAPGDTARIGDLPGISNGVVTLNISDTVAGLEISDGMTLRMNTQSLSVGGHTKVSGLNIVGQNEYPSTLRVQEGAGFYDLWTDHLRAEDQALVLLDGGPRVRVDDTLITTTGGILRGRGYVDMFSDGTPSLINGGLIHATGDLTIFTIGDGLFDLDGTNGSGDVLVDTQDGSSLIIVADGLSDDFSGDIHLTSDSRFSMQVTGGWTADTTSSITVEGILAQGPLPPARLAGSEVTIEGDVDVDGFGGRLSVDANAVLQESAEVIIGFGDQVEFAGDTTINGGWFFLNEGATLDFDGPTVIEGGTFTTFGVEDEDGDVDFNGPTTWDGEVTINGRAQQNGDATVDSAAVINATVFDISGESGQTNWDINHALTINAESVKTHGFDFFEGQIDIGGNLLARLTVNFTGDQQAAWSMRGEMNLQGIADPFFVTRLGGSPVLGTGQFNISNNVQVDAELIMMSAGTLNFESPAAELRTNGKTWLREDTVFSGQGTLRNGTPGQMTLYHELSLGQVGLANQGLLTFWRYGGPDLAVLATVDRFTNEDSGTLLVRIGGSDLGETYDHLLVTGAASLDGQIEVSFLDNGYAPKIGDEFTILTAAGGIAGTFVNKPVTTDGPFTYKWTVEHGANSVTLRLADIDGCSADLAETFGVLDLFDFLAFVNYFNAGAPEGDRDANGIYDLFDFLMYVNEFNAGC